MFVAVTDGLDRFREFQILLPAGWGKATHIPTGGKPNLTILHCQLGKRTDRGR